MATVTDLRVELMDLNLCYATYQSAGAPAHVVQCPDSRVIIVGDLEIVQTSANYLVFNIYEHARLADGIAIPAVGRGPFPIIYSGRYVVSQNERETDVAD